MLASISRVSLSAPTEDTTRAKISDRTSDRNFAASFSSDARSTPASTSPEASRDGFGTLRRVNHEASSSSRSLCSSASRGEAEASRSTRLSSKEASDERSSQESEASSSVLFIRRSSRMYSRRLSAARPAAEAGLLSSWANPAESLPSALNLSRCCSARLYSRIRSANTPISRGSSSGIRCSIS